MLPVEGVLKLRLESASLDLRRGYAAPGQEGGRQGVHGAGGAPRQAQVLGVFRCMVCEGEMISSLDLIDGRGPGCPRPPAAKIF